MVKSYCERFCAINRIEINLCISQINVSEHLNATLIMLIIAKLYKYRPVFQCNVHIMRAFHDILRVIGLSRVIACGALYLESQESF